MGFKILNISRYRYDPNYFIQERENQEAKQRREHFLQSSRVVAAANASVGHKSEPGPESTESSDSGSSFGTRERGPGANIQPRQRDGARGYIRVPTSETTGDNREPPVTR